jgi:aminoacrylate hydrolase
VPFASGDSARIHYEERGDGEPIVLIPGLGMSLATWADVAGRLAGRHRAIAVDPRGSGASDKPDEPYTGELLAGDIAAVLDDAGVESAHVVGMSMGGMIGQELAIRHPARVRSLVLVSTYAAADEWTARIFEVRRGVLEREGIDAQLRLGLLFVFSPRSFREMREWISGLEQRLGDDPPDERAYRRQLDFCAAHDAVRRLGEIAVPALVVVGTHDPLTSPELARELAGLIPGAEYRECEGASHALIWERGELFAELVEGLVDRVEVAAG